MHVHMYMHIHVNTHKYMYMCVIKLSINHNTRASTRYSFPLLKLLCDHFFFVVLVPLGVDGGHEHGSAPAVWYAGNSQEVSFQGRLLLSLHI